MMWYMLSIQETDYNTNTSNHTLYSYNAKTNKKEETSFLTNARRTQDSYLLYVEYQS